MTERRSFSTVVVDSEPGPPTLAATRGQPAELLVERAALPGADTAGLDLVDGDDPGRVPPNEISDRSTQIDLSAGELPVRRRCELVEVDGDSGDTAQACRLHGGATDRPCTERLVDVVDDGVHGRSAVGELGDQLMDPDSRCGIHRCAPGVSGGVMAHHLYTSSLTPEPGPGGRVAPAQPAFPV